VLLHRIVRSVSKTIGMTLPTVGELYETCVIKKTRDGFKDTSHPRHKLYSVVTSVKKARKNRYCNSFLLILIVIVNVM